MNQNSYDSDTRSETELRPTQPTSHFFFGRRRVPDTEPYSLTDAGSSAQLSSFVILFAILLNTIIGTANQSVIIGIGSFVAIVILVIVGNLLIQGIRKRNNRF